MNLTWHAAVIDGEKRARPERDRLPGWGGFGRQGNESGASLTHLEELEAESIHIIREVVAETSSAC
jgi:hypothetical protein